MIFENILFLWSIFIISLKNWNKNLVKIARYN